MKKLYPHQAVVRVWRNLKMLSKVPTSHFGHASVMVTGDSVRTTDFDYPHMQNISFWPANATGLGNAFEDQPGDFTASSAEDKVSEMNNLTAIRLEVAFCRREKIDYPAAWDRALAEAGKAPLPSPRQGQKRYVDPSTGLTTLVPQKRYWLKDGTSAPIPLYSQSPQSKIFLPGLLIKGRSWGLNLTRMANWWIDFQETEPVYRAFSPNNNCVGVVFQALREGGAEAFVKIPKVRAYGEPLQAEQYARDLEKAFEQIERETAILRMDREVRYCNQNPIPANQLMDGLWTLANWKRASALGVLYRRSALIVEIDDLLERFFRLTWKYGFVEKYGLLVRLFRAVLRHRADKSDSKRSYAVAQLGSQILEVLEKTGFYDGYRPARA